MRCTPLAPLLILTLASFAGEAEPPLLDAGLKRGFVDLAAARAKARKILIDDRRYPVPAKAYAGWRAGVDQQPGHRDMEALVCRAVIKHNEVATALAKRIGASTRTLDLK